MPPAPRTFQLSVKVRPAGVRKPPANFFECPKPGSHRPRCPLCSYCDRISALFLSELQNDRRSASSRARVSGDLSLVKEITRIEIYIRWPRLLLTLGQSGFWCVREACFQEGCVKYMPSEIERRGVFICFVTAYWEMEFCCQL